MPKRNRKPFLRREWEKINRHVNFNTILTTVLGSLACTGVGLGLKWTADNYRLLQSIPTIQQDIKLIKSEQDRVKKEYAPPLAHP